MNSDNGPSKEEDNSPDGKGLRFRVYDIIFGHHTTAGLAFDLTLLLVITFNIVLVCLETVPSVEKRLETEVDFRNWFLIAEAVFTLIFTVEYAVRIWCVKDPWKYIFSFFGIVDLLAVLPSLIGLIWFFGFVYGTDADIRNLGTATGSYSVIRSLRLLRVFRLIRIGKLEHESSELARAVWKARIKVIVFVLVVMITVVIAGTLMYELEHRVSDSKFQSIPEGIYWAIVTMTTVGYGDIVPTTILGKFISSMLILIGYSLIIVPTGFVSAEVLGSRSLFVKDQRRCAQCQLIGHELDAQFCKSCGAELTLSPSVHTGPNSSSATESKSGLTDS